MEYRRRTRKEKDFKDRMSRRTLSLLGLLGLLFASPSMAEAQRNREAQLPAMVTRVSKDVLPGLGSKSLVFGVNVVWRNGGRGWEQGDRAKRLVERMKAVGATNTRVEIRWADIEKARGQYDWKESDGILRFLSAQGFVVACVVTGVPEWAYETDSAINALYKERGMEALRSLAPPALERLDDFGKFAYELGRRYKDVVHRWEVWSEPDGAGMTTLVKDSSGKAIDIRPGGDVILYTRLLSAFSSGVKRSDPAAVIAIGGLAVPNTQFLEGIYVNGGKGAFSAIALHPCRGNLSVDFTWIDACRNLLMSHGDKSKALWLSEWGWNTYPENPDGITEGEQARFVRMAFAGMATRPFIEQADYQTLNDWRTDTAAPLSLISRGLCDEGLEPRRAFRVFQAEAFHVPPPLTGFRTIPLFNNLPQSYQQKAIAVRIDTDKTAETLPRFWSGITLLPHIVKSPEFDTEKRLPVLQGAPPLIRFAPLSIPGALELDAEGKPSVHWDVIDTALLAIGQRKSALLCSIPPILLLKPEAWEAFLTTLIKHIGGDPRFKVARWELEATPLEAKERYEAFVRVAQREQPNSPAGVYFPAADWMETLEVFLEECIARNLALNALSWRLREPPAEEARILRQMKSALAQHPTLKNTRLLPELYTDTRDNPTLYVAQTLRLLDYCPPAQANELLGVMTFYRGLQEANGEASGMAKSLALLNQMTGKRIPLDCESSAVRALGARGTDGIRILLWREAGEGVQLVNLRFVGLGGAAADAPRAYRIQIYSYNAPTQPLTTFDIPAGETELPVLMDAQETLLIEIKQVESSPFVLGTSLSQFVYRSGNALQGEVSARNLLNTPLPFELGITTSLDSALATKSKPASNGSLRPNVTRITRYAVPLSTVFRPTPAYLNFTVGKETRFALGFLVEPSLTANLETRAVDVVDGGAKMGVRVRNQGIVPFAITLRPEQEKDISFSIAGGESVMKTLTLHPPSSQPGNYPVNLYVESLGDPVTTLRPILRVPLLCRRVAKPLKIDGDLSDWDKQYTVELNRKEQAHDKQWGGIADLSGRFTLAWDETNLYIGGVIQDDKFVQPYPAEELWRGDSVVVGITPSRSASWEQVGYGDSDHEFGMALLNGVSPVIQRFWGMDMGTAKPQIAIKRQGTEITYEAAIPWAQLRPLTPQNSMLFGLCLQINDEDGRGRGYIEWGGSVGDAKRPGQFPSVRLVP